MSEFYETNKNFAEKREKLSTASTELKKHFVGIDYIIDSIISKITAWYLFPDITTRPMIINLWGMTGVGKTDLIRKLVKLLDFNDNFLEVQMQSKTTANWGGSLHYAISNSSIEPNEPAVILLDEFQRFRTIDDQKQEILDNDFQDVWMLLSDGKFSINASMKERLMQMLCDKIYYAEREDETSSSSDLEEFFPENFPKNSKKSKEQKNYEYKIPYYKAKEIKSLLSLDDEIKTIMSWSEKELFEVIEASLNNAAEIKQADYSKCLVFVSGNLDEVFRNALSVSDTDVDADHIHDKTSKLTVIDVKEGLKNRFKPEQISRLGNIHILYPSLSKSTYKELITRKLRALSDVVYEKCNSIRINFSNSIEDFIYENGVFPAQGTRPVFSTVDDMFNSCVPNFVIYALENNKDQITLEYREHEVVASIYDGKQPEQDAHIMTEYYVGDLDKIRNSSKARHDFIAAASVHEAGHALMWILLTGTSPSDVKIALTGYNIGGFVIPPEMLETKNAVFDKICVGLGGTIAEKLIFKQDKVTSGAVNDLSEITKLAARYYREHGFGDRRVFTTAASAEYATSFHCDESFSNAEIIKLLKLAEEKTENLLLSNLQPLTAIAKKLSISKELKPKEIAKICHRFGIECKVLSDNSEIIPEYAKILDNFVEYQLSESIKFLIKSNSNES